MKKLKKRINLFRIPSVIFVLLNAVYFADFALMDKELALKYSDNLILGFFFDTMYWFQFCGVLMGYFLEALTGYWLIFYTAGAIFQTILILYFFRIVLWNIEYTTTKEKGYEKGANRIEQ